MAVGITQMIGLINSLDKEAFWVFEASFLTDSSSIYIHSETGKFDW